MDDAMDFDEAWYVAQNPDVGAAIKEGRFSRGLDHYLAKGRSEGRRPSPLAGMTSGSEYQRLSAQQTKLGTLDELGIKRVTDKCSLQHDYLRKYERLFSPFRDLPITLLEIGVFNGGSLKLWEDYFPRAIIVGLDIRPECKQYEGGRRIVEIASQADPASLKAIGMRYQPSIIIDDGSHQADHILVSFKALFPTLRSGGIYIVEDLYMHAGPAAEGKRGSADESPQQYFLKLANRVVCPADDVQSDSGISATPESVEFFNSLAVIGKAPGREHDAVGQRRALVESVDSPESWRFFSGFIMRNGGALQEAIACAERAVTLAQENAVNHLALSFALERANRLEDSLKAAQRAMQLSPRDAFLIERTKTLAAKMARASS